MSQVLTAFLFILLPLLLVLRKVVLRGGDVIAEAHAALRFCLGTAKLLLLVIPLSEIALLVLQSGAVNASLGTAWLGLLSSFIGLALLGTAAVDVSAGLGGLFGLRAAPATESPPMPAKKKAALLLAMSLGLTLAITASLAEFGSFLKGLIIAPPKTIAVLFQNARVWTNYHILVFAAAAATHFLMPATREFLRIWRPWKATWSLGIFALAVVMLWTRISPVT